MRWNIPDDVLIVGVTGHSDGATSQTASIPVHVSSLCSVGSHSVAGGLQEAGTGSCLETPERHFRCVLVLKASYETSSDSRETWGVCFTTPHGSWIPETSDSAKPYIPSVFSMHTSL